MLATLMALALLPGTLLLGSCTQPGPSPVYGGINLISNVTFSQWTPDDQTVTYMSYGLTAESPPAEHPGAEVYRLEIRNLIPNGDFKATVPPAVPAGWAAVNGGGAVDTLETIAGPDPMEINGVTLHFFADDSADRMDFEITDGVNGSVDGFIQDASYIIRYRYRTQPSFIFEFSNGLSSISWWNVFSGPDGDTIGTDINRILDFPPGKLVGDFPEKTAGSAASYYYSFGSLNPANSKSQEGYIDDFRLIRTDIPLKLRLSLDQADVLQETIQAATFTFSMYIKKDPSVGVVNNRFDTDEVSLGLTVDSIGESSVSLFQAFRDGTDGDWSSWTRLSVEVYTQLSQPPGDSRKILLSICPSNDTQGSLSVDAGSILISAPSLEVSSN